MLKINSIKISMDGKWRALDNVSVERLWRTVNYENVSKKAYRKNPPNRLIWMTHPKLGIGLITCYGFQDNSTPSDDIFGIKVRGHHSFNLKRSPRTPTSRFCGPYNKKTTLRKIEWRRKETEY